MRYLVCIATLLTASAVADEQYSITHECTSQGIQFEVALKRPGVLTFIVPYDVCGKSI
jgi:hypothetical protein